MSDALELLGLLIVIVGLALFDWRLAVIAAGVVLVLVGLALDRPAR